ncbi:MAG: OB-fold nucleic acid binding domain-containing protein, partial [Granulosicoccus sp.]
SALRGADQFHKNKDAGQDDLFGLGEPVEADEPELMVLQEDWTDRERLRAEKDTLGLYLSGHPINEYLEEISNFTHGRLKAICAKAGSADSGPGYRPRGVPVVAAGLVMGMRQRDGQGGRMLFVTMDDGTARLEISLRGEQIDQCAHMIVKDEVLIVDGDVSPDEFNGGYKIRAREIYDMANARARFARQLLINIDGKQWPDSAMDELVNALSNYKSGTIPVWFNYRNGNAQARIRAGNRWAVNPQLELIDHLGKLTGEGNVELVY